MKWIVITMPDFIENEANYINQLFEAGLDLLHLRKPDSCIADCERLLQEINPNGIRESWFTTTFRSAGNIIFTASI